MKRVVLVLLLLLLIPLVSAVDYPSPQGYVNDYANIISPEYKSQIESLLTQLEQETTVEVAVLTVPNLQGQDKESYAVNVFREWGIGKKDVDNGLLILVGLEEREWRIEVGYGLEGLITDGMAGRIGRNKLVPNFQNEEYGKGIYEAVVDIRGFVEGEEEVISQYQEDDYTNDFDFIFIPFFIAMVVGGIVGVATKKIKNKKVKWGVRIGVAGLIFIGLIFWSTVFAVVFLVFYFMFSLGRGGMMFIPFGGRGRGGMGGGGFGGFGGGFSGGGGAGGRW